MAEESKPTNPKDAVSSNKARWFSYLPLRVLYGVGMAMFEGARKYGRHNYRIAGVRGTVYVDAAICGHLTPWMEGQDIDPESGAHHIDKAIASLMILRDGIYEGNWVDDRPPSVKNWDEFMAGQHANARELIARHPVPKDAFTIADTIHPKDEPLFPDPAPLKKLSTSCRSLKASGAHSFTTVSHPVDPRNGELFDYCDGCKGYRALNPLHADRVAG